MNQNEEDFQVICDETSGQVRSVRLYGEELLDEPKPCESELWVNDLPLQLRPHTDPNMRGKTLNHLKGEHWVSQMSGWGLVVARVMGHRPYLKHNCFGIQTLIRREISDLTCPPPGPGGPVIEAPLHVDTFSLLNWNWKFWGDDTRMIFPSSHSNGPDDEYGHVGYENDTPENAKNYLKNIWRRIYPGCMIVHGGLFYNAKTGHWIALTCRQPQVGYQLNIDKAGRGVGYDFTLHAPFQIGDSLQMPEIKIYFGQTHEAMMGWLGEYTTAYYEEPPAWVFKTAWSLGLSWSNQPTWSEQADHWEKQVEDGLCSGFSYSLVTNRPIRSGTTPLGYEPDPNHGSIAEFKAMGRRLADKNIPYLIWMSHSGLLYQGGRDIDDDWFIRGIDGRVAASWGSIDQGGLTHINPGHPGYIEYTKKWIRFYIKECGAKGIFFDCLSWAFPPDFTPRSWMRYPGDTNLMGVKFMQEIYAYIKECDPEAIMLGEGSSLEGPVNVFSIHSNPKRALDGLGPRDFLLQLNRYSPKRMVIDQGPRFFPASGWNVLGRGEENLELSRYFTQLLRERGGRDAFTHLPNDLSILDDLLFVPFGKKDATHNIALPATWSEVKRLRAEIGDALLEANGAGAFENVPPGIYRMERN